MGSTNIHIPQVTATIEGHAREIDVLSQQFTKSRQINLIGEVNENCAEVLCAKLRYLDAKSHEPILLLINSGGGEIASGMMIHDTIQYGIQSEVHTLACGMAASMAAFILAASGTKGHRYATPNSEIMIHQPLGGAQGQATDISLVAAHIEQLKRNLATMLASACNQDTARLMADMERDLWMTAQQALEYGLIDHIGFPTEGALV